MRQFVRLCTGAYVQSGLHFLRGAGRLFLACSSGIAVDISRKVTTLISFRDDDHPESFGVWVRQQRAILRLTQREFAMCIGLAPSIVCRIEQGKRAWAAPQVEAWLTRGQEIILHAQRVRAEAQALRAAHATRTVRVLRVLADSQRLQALLLAARLAAAD